jgi:ABC-type transporter Mla maintaining outer membrane lipid asymmetry ATPase subunit MlaF
VIALDRVFQHVGGRCALNDLTLRVQAGDALLIVGPNGAGKSLTLRLMLGLDQPSAGTIRAFGQDLAQLDDRGLSQLRGRLGAMLQGGSLLDELSVLENLLLPLRSSPHDPASMARAARLAVTQLRLDGMENQYPRALSLGQRRRTELARALIGQPEVLLCDGLGDGLDQPAVRDILEVLRTQREAKGLTVIATDNRLLDLIGPSDRVAVLDRGQLLFDGARAELEHNAKDNLEIRTLLAGHP